MDATHCATVLPTGSHLFAANEIKIERISFNCNSNQVTFPESLSAILALTNHLLCVDENSHENCHM
jgi:hypothetical protein